MSVTIADLMSRTSDTSRRIQRLLATFEQPPAAGVRSAAARFAGISRGLPQCERSGMTAAELCGEIDPDDRRE